MRLALPIAVLLCARQATAQTTPQPDTTAAPRLSTVVVTGERARNTIGSSVAAVTRLSAEDLARVPRATVADLLRLVPGVALVDFDGLGHDPQLIVRGFYGGGEAEYVIVLIDGRPVGELHTGRAAWDALPPLSSIEAVEIVRGSTSPLYGDAAIGGVINIITRADVGTSEIRWEAGGGSHGSARATVDAVAPWWKGLAVGAGLDRTDGYRDHARRASGRARARLVLVEHDHARLGVSARSHWRDFAEPGPLLESLLEQSRTASDPIFRFDETEDRGHALELDGWRRLGGSSRVSGSLGGERRHTSAIRTLPLAPGFGDTKERVASVTRLSGSVQLELGDSPLPGADRLVVGLEGGRGTLDSRYYGIASGTRDDYAAASGERQALDARGESTRTSGALFAQYTLQASNVLRLSVGGRLDELRDALEPIVADGVNREAASHSAFSPRVGMNVRYHAGPRSVGTAYASFSRSFKAPTLDQLYDLRRIPVPFPPFAIRTSNPALVPQRGTSIEAGVYHGLDLAGLAATASVSAYQMDMKNELDFDVEAFRYVNIGRSRHRGVEAGATLASGRSSIVAAYTLQDAVARSGEFQGNRLKAIPRHTVSFGASARPVRTVETSVLVTHARGVELDDANTVPLPAHTRVDARVVVGAGGVDVLLDVRNLFDTRYSSTGFVDPGGSGEIYFHPAAGRVLALGVRGGW